MATKKKKASSKKATKKKTPAKRQRAKASTAPVFGIRKNARKSMLNSLLGFKTEGRGRQAIKDEIRDLLRARGDVHPAILEFYVKEMEAHYYRMVFICKAMMEVDLTNKKASKDNAWMNAYSQATVKIRETGAAISDEEYLLAKKRGK